MIILVIHILVFSNLILKETFIMLFSTMLLKLLFNMTFNLDFTKFIESLEDIILIIFHLDRVYDLFDLSEDIIVLCLDPSHDFLPSE